MIKAIFFDVDNTLYDVKQYMAGTLGEVARYLSDRYHISSRQTQKTAMALWEQKTSAYPYLFNDLLAELKIAPTPKLVHTMVKIFNDYRCPLKPYPGLITVLRQLKRQKYTLGIITDGNIQRQAQKIKALGIQHFFDYIIYTKNFNPKPSPKPFQAAIKKLNISSYQTIYVGDNPLLDFSGAKRSGMKTVRILKGEFKTCPHNQYIDKKIFNFRDLCKTIKKM